MALWDDVADAITYCNHYMAASNAALTDIAATFAAYAKYEVRGGEGRGGTSGRGLGCRGCGNRYMAASNAALTDIAATFAAYAKYEVFSGDGFQPLWISPFEVLGALLMTSNDDTILDQVYGSILFGCNQECTKCASLALAQKNIRFSGHLNTYIRFSRSRNTNGSVATGGDMCVCLCVRGGGTTLGALESGEAACFVLTFSHTLIFLCCCCCCCCHHPPG
jgi:hypothetical protein